jgi:hypothetical protein
MDDIMGPWMWMVAVSERTGEISIAGEMKPLCLIHLKHPLENVTVSELQGSWILTSSNTTGKVTLSVDKVKRMATLKESSSNKDLIKWDTFYYAASGIKSLTNGFETVHPPLLNKYIMNRGQRERGNIRVTHASTRRVQKIDGNTPMRQSVWLFNTEPQDYAMTLEQLGLRPGTNQMDGYTFRVSLEGSNSISATFAVVPPDPSRN